MSHAKVFKSLKQRYSCLTRHVSSKRSLMLNKACPHMTKVSCKGIHVSHLTNKLYLMLFMTVVSWSTFHLKYYIFQRS
jgi:hypothetical protein